MDTTTDKKVLICFIGQQPAPNLLSLLHYRPEQVILVCSDFTAPTAANLTRLMSNHDIIGFKCEVGEPLEVSAYDIDAICARLMEQIKGYSGSQLIFNLTGGTKIMSHAGYQIARTCMGSMLMYIESERNCQYLYEYSISEGGALTPLSAAPPVLGAVMNIRLYLHAQGIDWKTGKTSGSAEGIKFEREVAAAFAGAMSVGRIDECLTNIKDNNRANVEIDVLVRCGNQIAVLEVKQGDKAKGIDGIKQLQTFASNLYLGTYARRFLVVDRDPDPDNEELAKLLGIRVIKLPSYAAGLTLADKAISQDEQEQLIAQVIDKLKCEPSQE